MSSNQSLMQQVANADNLWEAWSRVRATAAAGGLDGRTTADFDAAAEKYLEKLGASLIEGNYVPVPTKSIRVPKRGKSGQTRTLTIPSVTDKVAQEAVRRIVGPVLDRKFLDVSYAYRPRKGPQKAVRRVRHILRHARCQWVARADIDDFFDSVDHDRLVRRLAKVLHDDAVVRLIELWLKMGTVDPAGFWHQRDTGLGQGAVISPLLANFYLHPFDEYLVRRAPHLRLVRYADDFLICALSKAAAEEGYCRAADFLALDLSLRLNANPRPVVSVEEGFAFLGVRFRGDALDLDSSRIERIRAKAGQVLLRALPDDLQRTVSTLNESLAGWHNYYGSLLGPAGSALVEGAVVEGLSSALAAKGVVDALGGKGRARELLASLEFPATRNRAGRRALAERIVRSAGARTPPGAGRPTAATPPRGSSRPVTQPRNEARSKSVAATVRRARAVYGRSQAPISELVLATPGTFLGVRGERLSVRRGRQVLRELPLRQVRSVTIATRGVALSSDAVHACCAHDVAVLFVTPPGRAEALLIGAEGAPAQLQVGQLRACEQPDKALELAGRFVSGKTRGQRSFARYLGKYHRGANPGFAEPLDRLLDVGDRILGELKRLMRGKDAGEDFRGKLFSIEGRFAALYWDVYGAAMNGRAPDFSGRKRKGAGDRVNSLLNYGYAVLRARCHHGLLGAGLNPQVSYLHAPRAKVPTLVFDFMEEFRAPVVDRTVLALITRREPVALGDDGLLTLPTRALLIRRLHERLATVLRFRGREMTLGEVIAHQAQLLARHLLGEAAYQPFVAKW